MSRTPNLLKIPGPFMKAVARLLQTAPPPKTAKDRKVIDDGLKALDEMKKKRAVLKKRAPAKAKKAR